MSEPLLRLQYRLTPRHLVLLGWLADHGVLTTGQIAHALYPSLGFAQRRLGRLVGAGVLDRFRPHRVDGGSHPYHYLLAQLGVEVMAAQRDAEHLPRRDQARKRRWWLTNRANLPHLLAVNGFFTDLVGHARTHPEAELTRWWPSSRCQQPDAFKELEAGAAIPSRVYAATVAADGHGIWTEYSDGPLDGQTVKVPFFTEIDLGTEDLSRVVGKVAAYEAFSRACGRVWPVLFWLDLPVRERHPQTRLAETSTFAPLATATSQYADHFGLGPAKDVWWLHGRPEADRHTLADLAATVTWTEQTWK